ncbi:MAG: hypothetical protein ABII27_06680 [bacterium]
MKKMLGLSMVFSFLFVVVSQLQAHPPSDIKITFDTETKMLDAVISHAVSNPIKHFIKKVDVGLNGMEIISQSISREDNNDTQTVRYLIPDAKVGDEISVEGYCSISGKLTKKITVQSKKAKADSNK